MIKKKATSRQLSASKKTSSPFILILLIPLWILNNLGSFMVTLFTLLTTKVRKGGKYFNFEKKRFSHLSSATLRKINFYLTPTPKPVTRKQVNLTLKTDHRKLKTNQRSSPPGKDLLAYLGNCLVLLWKIIFPETTAKPKPVVVKKPVTKAFGLQLSHKHRGRPRTQPFLRFYLGKIKRRLGRIFPRPVRYGIVATLIFGLIFSYSFVLIDLAHSLPSPDQLSNSKNPLTTEIYDRNGKLLYQVYEGRNRKLVKLEEIPQNLVNATIAIEDKNFYSHPGIDVFGIIRALRENSDKTNSQEYHGGSTITQQLIKNTLLTPDKTWERKVKEALLAFWAERIFNKQQILGMYFNESPYGGPAWGAQAAAQMYFGKDVSQLDLAESAYLAGLPAAPTDYSPYGAHPEKGKERQREVLRRMVEDHYISQEQADQAVTKELSFNAPQINIKAPHFVMYIRSLLAQKYGERTVSQGGLKVITSLDLDIQELAEKVVLTEVNKLTNLQVGNGAAMVTDAKTGQILAMVGSKNYFDPKGGNFNVALALRQPGSAIKPVTFITGFKKGYSPGSVMLDNPVTFVNPWGASYSPVNYDGRFHGLVSIRTALGSSYNIPAVKMLALVGVPAMLETASDLGITTLTDTDNYGLSLTLGGGAVPLIEMMSVYNTLSQNGNRYPIQGVLSVTDAQGHVLEDNQHPTPKQVIAPEIAYLITNILSDPKARIPAFGPNSLLEIKDHSNVAVKTGTSDEKRDNWAFGYTPEFVVGSWVGNNDNSLMNQQIASGITGATPIWHEIMTALVKDRQNLAFERPAGIVETRIDGNRDLAIAGQGSKTTVSLSKSKQQEASTGAEREVITFSDSFSWGIPVTPNH